MILTKHDIGISFGFEEFPTKFANRYCGRPPGIDANSRLYVVLRVLFNADGLMQQTPVLVEGSSSPLAPALAESAKRAISPPCHSVKYLGKFVATER
jgi:hypothetical protein